MGKPSSGVLAVLSRQNLEKTSSTGGSIKLPVPALISEGITVAMLYRSYTPAAPLMDYIERFWLSFDAPLHLRGRVLPSGTMELVVNLRDDEIRIFDPSQSDEPHRFT